MFTVNNKDTRTTPLAIRLLHTFTGALYTTYISYTTCFNRVWERRVKSIKILMMSQNCQTHFKNTEANAPKFVYCV